MTTAQFSRLFLAVTLTVVCACNSNSEPKPGLPPPNSGTALTPSVPGTPTTQNILNTSTPVTSPTRISNRYVGTALPKHSAELGPKMNGTLTAVLAEEGDSVKKGQVLFRLDARTSRLGITQAETALEGAAIARDNALKELERQRTLAEKGTISPAVLERYEATYNSSVNSVNQAEVAVSMAKRSSNDSAVSSPIDGVVARKFKSVGETVTNMPPTTVLLIQDHTTIELRARIPEVALKQVREGNVITAHFSAVDVVREAKVVRIQPTVDPTTRTIEIVADVDNNDNVLRPGMYVEVELAPPSTAAESAAAAPEVPAPTKGKVATRKPRQAAAEDATQ